ncbi:MAG: Gfo/Idh/MocA family oxidoreductase, partial [Spirochaetia bacterium]|nr:Gfo/Idh/MocA family oxidoreductase [Spirochaetia bacterium]
QCTAVSDIDPARAQARAKEFDIPRVLTPDELIKDKDIDIVLNLTIPAAHAEVNLKALEAGKHAFTEKPFATSVADAKKVLETAKKKNLLVGCAPDTVLGGGTQTCRKLIDEGLIGDVIGATAFMASHGPESWHPDPEFFYQPGGGPMLDMGPYYLSSLVQLVGPIKKISAITKASFAERTVGSGAKAGKKIKVEVPTHYSGQALFENGAVATLVMSFDVWAAKLPRIEIYGTKGSLSVPDPNTFGGPIFYFDPSFKDWVEMKLVLGFQENARGLGLADMAQAVRDKRAHRASGDMAAHVLEAMLSFEESSKQGKPIELSIPCKRPDAMKAGEILSTLK